MPRGRFRGNFPARARRITSWEFGPGGTADTTLTSSSVAILGAGGVATRAGLTVIRTRGAFELTLKSVDATASHMTGAVGIGIATPEAFAIGVTAVATPITESAWDGWMWWQAFSMKAASTSATFATGGSASLRLEVDSKAMRKLDLADTIYAAVEVVEVGAVVMTVAFDSRVLVKLP